MGLEADGRYSIETMRKLLILFCALAAILVGATLPMSGEGQHQTVLVIYSTERGSPNANQIDEKLRETLSVHTNLDIRYQTEYLDYPRYGDETDPSHDKLFSDFLRAKYINEPIAVIVAVGPPAFGFLRRHRDDLFVNSPVLVIATNHADYEEQPLPSRFLYLPSDLDLRATFEMAMRLQPKASEIVVVAGTSKIDLDEIKDIRQTLAGMQAHPPVRYLSDLSLNDVLGELSRLPPNSIVYTLGLNRYRMRRRRTM
jgi:hypothetical protein